MHTEDLNVYPHPDTLYPLKDPRNYSKLVFLKNIVKAKNILIGDYTYFDDFRNGPEHFEEHNVLYNYNPNIRLIIGKFCALAAETRFIMAGDHKLDGFSTYPFASFGGLWESAYNLLDLPAKGDILVGNDVWFGYDSIVRSGVTIGNGAIIATRAVVVKDVPAYSVVAGNPARVVKMRFDDKTIERLQKIAWWDWSIDKINRNLRLICHRDLDRLETAE